MKRAVTLAVQQRVDLGLLPRARNLIEQAILKGALPIAATFRQLVALITTLLPEAWYRLRGLVPAQNTPEQVVQQPAAQIELAPKSPDKAPARNALKRAHSTSATANRSRLSTLDTPLPPRLDSNFVVNLNKHPRLFQTNRYLLAPYSSTTSTSVGFVQTPRHSNPIVVNVGIKQVKATSSGALQYSCLGSYWVK